MDFDDLCATYFSCKTKISHLYEIVIFQAKLHFLDSEKEKEAEGGGFGPGAYINGSAVSKNSKNKVNTENLRYKQFQKHNENSVKSTVKK